MIILFFRFSYRTTNHGPKANFCGYDALHSPFNKDLEAGMRLSVKKKGKGIATSTIHTPRHA